MNRSRLHASWMLLLVLLLSTSCNTSKDAVATAAQMTETAKQLADYYAALDKVVDNHAKLERLQKAVLDVPLDEQDLAQLKSVHYEIEKRAVMARSLAHLAAELTALTKSTAPADVSTAATSLGTELSDIQQLPGASYAPSVLPPAGKMLTQMALEHDERKLAKAMEPTMNALSDMFTHERVAYDSINKTYIGLAQSIAKELVKREQVDPAGLMAPALMPFGLAGRMPSEKLPQGLTDYAREEIDRRGQDEITAQAAATETMDKALTEMSKRVHELATSGRMPERGFSFTFSDIQEWTQQLP